MLTAGWTSLRAYSQRFSVKLMLLYLGLLLIPVLGIGSFGDFYIQRSIEHYKHQLYLEAIALHAEALNRTIDHIQGDILYLEQQIVSRSGPALGQFAAAHTLYQDAVLLDAENRVSAGYAAESVHAQLGTIGNSLYELPLHEVQFYGAPEPDGSASLVAAARIDSGTLILTLNSHALLSGLGMIPSGEGWALLLPTGASLVSHEIPTELPEMQGTAGYTAWLDNVLFFHRAGPKEDWLLVHHVPAAAVRANLSDYYTTFTILLTGSVITVVGFALFAIARIIEPIYQLKGLFDNFRETDTPPKLPHNLPNDEFGDLMASFTQLTTELEQKRRIERELVEQLIAAQEEERKLIAYDLHDGLIQQLVGARFQLRKCKTCTIPSVADSKEALRGYDILTQAISEGRRIIQGLHPTALDDLGLEAALSDLVEMSATTAGWATECCIDPLPASIHRVTAVTLYRIAQEALNNAFKHADATSIRLAVRADHTQLTMEITDNGCGFVPEHTLCGRSSGGWGIRTMHERAKMIQGACHIESHPGHGTTIRVEIPFQPEENKQ